MVVSSSPHLKSRDTTRGIMLDVIIALVPAAIASCVLFGYRAALLIAVCVASCVGFEFLSNKVMKKPVSVGDLSAVVTGVLLAFNLPSSLPLWMAVIGSAAAIIVVKQFFGGLGQNFVNPALVGRIVLMVSFPSQMSNWPIPLSNKVDAVTSATPMASLGQIYKEGITSDSFGAGMPTLLEMFIGHRQGCIGEVCAAALLLGGLYLIVRRVISPIIPFTYIGTVAVIMLIAGKGNMQFLAYELLGGGLILGAFFMATDYVTSPITKKGKVVFAIGCGIITAAIRLFGSLPEGVSFSIIIMNILVPQIEKLTASKPFGFIKEKKKGDAK